MSTHSSLSLGSSTGRALRGVLDNPRTSLGSNRTPTSRLYYIARHRTSGGSSRLGLLSQQLLSLILRLQRVANTGQERHCCHAQARPSPTRLSTFEHTFDGSDRISHIGNLPNNRYQPHADGRHLPQQRRGPLVEITLECLGRRLLRGASWNGPFCRRRSGFFASFSTSRQRTWGR